jgi:hypothetical protein
MRCYRCRCRRGRVFSVRAGAADAAADMSVALRPSGPAWTSDGEARLHLRADAVAHGDVRECARASSGL